MRPLPQLRATQSHTEYSTTSLERQHVRIHDGDVDARILVLAAEALVNRQAVHKAVVLNHAPVGQAVKHCSHALVEVRARGLVLGGIRLDLTIGGEMRLGSGEAEHQRNTNRAING